MAAKNYLEFHVNGMTYTIEQMQTLSFAPDAKVIVYYVGLKKVWVIENIFKNLFGS